MKLLIALSGKQNWITVVNYSHLILVDGRWARIIITYITQGSRFNLVLGLPYFNEGREGWLVPNWFQNVPAGLGPPCMSLPLLRHDFLVLCHFQKLIMFFKVCTQAGLVLCSGRENSNFAVCWELYISVSLTRSPLLIFFKQFSFATKWFLDFFLFKSKLSFQRRIGRDSNNIEIL